MKLGKGRAILGTVAIMGLLSPSAPAAQNAPLAEEIWPGIELLRGRPADEFRDTMGMFAAALGKCCTECHDPAILNDWDAFAVDTPTIEISRGMIRMVDALNRDNFGGANVVTCFTCHQGKTTPDGVPDLELQYGVPRDQPNSMQIFPSAAADSPEEIFDRYIAELGGAEQLANFTSFVAQGSYSGFETGGQDIPVEIFAQAPNRRTVVMGGTEVNKVKVYDGTNAWIVEESFVAIPLMPLTGGNLDGADLEALLSFPSSIQSEFSRWRVGTTIIDDRDVQVVQGTRPGKRPVNFYFDDSDLLVRVVYWKDTAVGTVSTQLDFADYREVSGVKMPFQFTETWTTGQITTQLSDVQANVAIDPTRFGRPTL